MPKKHSGHRGILDFSLGALSAGAILSVLAGGYKTAEFLIHAKRLTEVGHENAVYVRIIERVRLDLKETDRLLKLPEVKHAMANAPEKLGWIKRTITAMKESVTEMNKYVRRVSGDVERGGWIGVRHRFRWVLDDSEKALRCRGEVGICHEGLLEVLAFLSAFEELNCCKEDGKYEEEVVRYEDDEFELQKKYEEKARFILQQERAFQGRSERRVEERNEERRGDRYDDRSEDRYEDRYETRSEGGYEERPQRQGNSSYEEQRGGYVDREVSPSLTNLSLKSTQSPLPPIPLKHNSNNPF
jgi:hypothetical protein